MTRIEVKKKLDELLKSFNPENCDVTNFKLDDNEYDLIVNTVWQLKSGIKEEDSINTNLLLDKIHNADNRERCIAQLLRGLLAKCNLLNYYFSNKNQ